MDGELNGICESTKNDEVCVEYNGGSVHVDKIYIRDPMLVHGMGTIFEKQPDNTYRLIRGSSFKLDRAVWCREVCGEALQKEKEKATKKELEEKTDEEEEKADKEKKKAEEEKKNAEQKEKKEKEQRLKNEKEICSFFPTRPPLSQFNKALAAAKKYWDLAYSLGFNQASIVLEIIEEAEKEKEKIRNVEKLPSELVNGDIAGRMVVTRKTENYEKLLSQWHALARYFGHTVFRLYVTGRGEQLDDGDDVAYLLERFTVEWDEDQEEEKEAAFPFAGCRWVKKV